MEERLAYYETHPDQIDTRLAELDREWDIERTLEANASTLAFTGTMLAATGDRRWLALPAIVTGFLFQHAIQGWCPPLQILRRLGFRTWLQEFGAFGYSRVIGRLKRFLRTRIDSPRTRNPSFRHH